MKKAKKTTDAADQVNRLAESLETYTKHSVSCWLCGESDSGRDVTESQYARSLLERGWRWEASEKYGTVGAMCPECVKIPDAER